MMDDSILGVWIYWDPESGQKAKRCDCDYLGLHWLNKADAFGGCEPPCCPPTPLELDAPVI